MNTYDRRVTVLGITDPEMPFWPSTPVKVFHLDDRLQGGDYQLMPLVDSRVEGALGDTLCNWVGSGWPGRSP